MTYNIGDRGLVVTTRSMGSEFIKNNATAALNDKVLVYPILDKAIPVAIPATASEATDRVYAVPLGNSGGWAVQQPQPKFTIEDPEVPPSTTVVEFDIRIDEYPSSSYWGYELFSRATSGTNIVWMFGFSGIGSDTYPYRLKVMATQGGVFKYVCDASKQLYIGTTYHIVWTASGGMSGMTRNGLPQGVPYPCVLEYGLTAQLNYPDAVVGTGLSHGTHQAFGSTKGAISNITITNS